ncbi:MAG TPA: PIG-L family deacetylase [Terriglobales bacterium]|nr:PIG-L family deacetylase [Terriglobales bacterium]
MFRLLCITAHPDDEVGGFGGTLLLYGSRGVETYVTCLTPGQAATNRGGARSDAELAAMRRAEFAEACKILRVHHGEVLDYPDARLYRVDFFEVVGVLTRRIREIRPHVVLTIGPEGAITAHPDHSMASVFATVAYHWAGRSNHYPEQLINGLKPHRAQKLYYATANFVLEDRPPVSLPPATAIIEVGDILETKIIAFSAHVSQRPLLPIFEKTIRNRGACERYHLAAAITPRTLDGIEHDLFTGVIE